MKKIKTVFRIDRDKRCAVAELMAESEWVLSGEGIATIKFDGTAACVQGGKLFKRYDRKLLKRYAKILRAGDNIALTEAMFKTPPEGFEPVEKDPDPKTGHWPGWLAVDTSPENRWFNEAWEGDVYEDGTYELVGPKVQSNRYGLEKHELWRHGSRTVTVERSFEGIRNWLHDNREEGLVFHHPDGRMAKIRRKDFQLDW